MVVTLTSLNNTYKLPSYKNLTMIREGKNVRHESMAYALPVHAKQGKVGKPESKQLTELQLNLWRIDN